MPRDLREQMVHSLELQPAVDEVQPFRTVDVHGGSELALREGFGIPEISGRHGPVRQGNLDVQGHCDDVRNQDKSDPGRPVRQCKPHNAVAKPEPVAHNECDLGGSNPPCHSTLCPRGRKQVMHGEHVQVEPCDGHDGIVGVVLISDGIVGDFIPRKREVVVGGTE